MLILFRAICISSSEVFISEEILSNFEGKRMKIDYFWYSGNDLKSGKVIPGMGGRFRPEYAIRVTS